MQMLELHVWYFLKYKTALQHLHQDMFFPRLNYSA